MREDNLLAARSAFYAFLEFDLYILTLDKINLKYYRTGCQDNIPNAIIPNVIIPDAIIPDAIIPNAYIPNAYISNANILNANIPNASISNAKNAIHFDIFVH